MFGRVESSPRRLYCELKDYRVFITPNDLSATWRGAAQRTECFWTQTMEREAAREEGTRNNGVRLLRASTFTRGCSSNRSATRTRPLFIDLPELELRVAKDKPPDFSCSPWTDEANLVHIRPIRIGESRFTCLICGNSRRH